MYYANKSVIEMMNHFKCTKSAIYFALHGMGLYLKARRIGSEKTTWIKMTYREADILLEAIDGNKKLIRVESLLKKRTSKNEPFAINAEDVGLV